MEVFISYARSTANLAESLESALISEGYSVWRDTQLPAHRAYAQVIEERLNAAQAVLVVWSADAIKSEWVMSEADRARQQRKLVQVKAERLALPMPFDQIQCADFTDWKSAQGGQAWRQVIDSLKDLVGREAVSRTKAQPSAHPSSNPAIQGNLPAAAGNLVGREADLAAVNEAIAHYPLVTVVGPGGVGKTSVCLEVARSAVGAHEKGVWLIELAGVSDGDRVPEILAKGLNLEIPAGRNASEELVERLRRRDCLLLIDNCEHVIMAVAQLAETIVSQAPGVKLLLTSQESLGLAGERVIPLRPLANVQATALFIERARTVEPGFQIGPGDSAMIADICKRLDGMPLAIEMAAARAPALGCAEVLRHLDDRFRILTGGRRTAMPRHRTLQGALDWSHGLLNARDAAVFRRLSVFAGSFSLPAASEIAADDTFDTFDVIDALASLVAKSLLTAKTADGRTRYILSETTRAYALEQLKGASEYDAQRRKHAQWYERYTKPFWTEFVARTSDAELLARQAPELENINRALDFAFGPDGDVDLGHRLLAASTVALDDRALSQRHAVAYPLIHDRTPPDIRAWLLSSRAHVAMLLNPRVALPVVEEAIAAVRTHIADPVRLCDTLASKVATLWSLGRADEARPIVDEMHELMADQPASRIKAFQLGLKARFVTGEDGPAAGLALFNEVVSSLRAFGARGDAIYWEMMSLRTIPPSDPDQDIQAWRAALRRIRPDDKYAEGLTMGAAKDLTRRLARRGLPADLEEALGLAHAVAKAGPAMIHRTFLLTMAMVAAKAGRHEASAQMLGYLSHPSRRAEGAGARADTQSVRALLIETLGEARLISLEQRGNDLSRSEAVRLALDETSATGETAK